MVSRYTNNFHKETGGNKLMQGQNLTITIDGDPTYVIGRLFKRGFLGIRNKLIQIEQSGHRSNRSCWYCQCPKRVRSGHSRENR